MIITIIRYRCTGCGKTHAILPDFLAPYRRYAMTVIEAAVTAVVEDGIPLEQAPGDQDTATTRRWVRRFLGLSEQATSLLGSILMRLRQEFLSLVTSDDGPCKKLAAGPRGTAGDPGHLQLRQGEHLADPGRRPALALTKIHTP